MKYVCNHKNILKDYGREVLRLRGIEDPESFLNPTAECLQSWRDLDNIVEGVNLLLSTINKENAHLALIVDCDVDGYTSSAIFYNYLKTIKPEVKITYFLHEGKQHGLEDTWQVILNSKDKYDLLVVPDAGSNDYEYTEKLKTINLPILILDHHIVEEDTKIGENCILINNQTSPNYRNKNLSGAGVMYQFCRAIDEIAGYNFANDFIDLAALGICADMMSGLEIENQYIWKTGFSNIKNYFFKVLCDKQAFSLNGKIYPIGVSFYIAPLINAMIRVGTSEEKERLFKAFIDGQSLVPSHKRGAKGTLEKVAIESARECTNAKTHQDKQKKELAEGLEFKAHKHDLFENKILFIRLDDDDIFPSELNGLLAMQLSAKHHMPTIIGRLNDEGYIRGSARGLSDSELTSFKDYLNSTGLFEYTAGHDNAFGISIKKENLDKLHAMANEDFKDIDFGNKVWDVDFVRIAADTDIAKIVYDLEPYEPIWSQQNNQPLIAINDIYINSSDIQVMGKNKDTMKFIKNGITYIKFFAKDLIQDLQQFPGLIHINIVGETAVNEWAGKTSPQIRIKDIEFEDGTLGF